MSAAPDPLVPLLADPAGSLAVLDRLDAEAGLVEFMRQGWAALEPGQPLMVSWPLEAVAEHLEAVTAGEVRRLVINVPPGFTKSMSTNVFWPSWEWGPRRLPHLRYISAAHEQGLAIRDNLRGRDLMLSEWYQARWGEVWRFKSDANAKVMYENDARGWRKASSTGSGLTGYRGDRLILDDPHAVRDMESEPVREAALRWFSETLPTRLNDARKSAIVVIMQRVHERDVSGLILKEDLGYEHLCLPMEYERRSRCYTSVPRRDGTPPEKVRRLRRAGEPLPVWLGEDGLAPDPDTGDPRDELGERPLQPGESLGELVTVYPQDRRDREGALLWPARFPAEAVEELKATFRSWGGTYAEAGQLQQRPAPRGGGMFQRSDFQYLDAAPKGVEWVRGWDLAATKDGRAAHTAGVKMGIHQGRVVIADVRRKQASPGEVEDLLRATAEADGPRTHQDLPQDPGQAGKAQRRALTALLQGHSVYSSPESGSKPDRARPLAAQAEAGNLWLVRGPWNDAFVNEAALFPNGEFSDQIDAASRAHARCVLLARRRRTMAAPQVITA